MRNLDCNGSSLGHTLQSQIISGSIVYIYLLSVNSWDREIIHQVKFEKILSIDETRNVEK